jgi:hypothetical protein
MTKKQFNQIKRILRKQIDGVKNARPIGEIVDNLCFNGVITSRRHFQLKLKPALLAHGLALGASSDGMYICRWRRDYIEALTWYLNRIRAEKANGSEILSIANKRCSKSLD